MEYLRKRDLFVFVYFYKVYILNINPVHRQSNENSLFLYDSDVKENDKKNLYFKKTVVLFFEYWRDPNPYFQTYRYSYIGAFHLRNIQLVVVAAVS